MKVLFVVLLAGALQFAIASIIIGSGFDPVWALATAIPVGMLVGLLL